MPTGEGKKREVQSDIISTELRQNNQVEYVETVLEKQVFEKEKLRTNLQARERFSRLKKSLRKKSVSIL